MPHQKCSRDNFVLNRHFAYSKHLKLFVALHNLSDSTTWMSIHEFKGENCVCVSLNLYPRNEISSVISTRKTTGYPRKRLPEKLPLHSFWCSVNPKIKLNIHVLELFIQFLSVDIRRQFRCRCLKGDSHPMHQSFINEINIRIGFWCSNFAALLYYR